MNLNLAIIAGRLTNDPQLRSTGTGQSVASFSIATNRNWTDKAGMKQEQVEYHNIVVWGKQAEIASKYLTKGALVLIEGRLQTRTWQNKEGQNQKTTEIIANSIQFGPRAGNTQSGFAGGRTSDNQESVGKRDDGSQFTKNDELPTIEIDSDDIKPEDLPF